jgi:hypothetical protein
LPSRYSVPLTAGHRPPLCLAWGSLSAWL